MILVFRASDPQAAVAYATSRIWYSSLFLDKRRDERGKKTVGELFCLSVGVAVVLLFKPEVEEDNVDVVQDADDA